jgi:nitrate reductase (NAD(P)H)
MELTNLGSCVKKFVTNPLRHGRKHWAWIFWECAVPYRELAEGRELVIRAWDEHKNVQPEHITWVSDLSQCLLS